MKEKISLPPFEAQQQIAEMLHRESFLRQQTENCSALLNEYRTRLIADVVTGKLDVREAAAALPEVDPLETEDEPEDVIDADAEEPVAELNTVLEEAEA